MFSPTDSTLSRIRKELQEQSSLQPLTDASTPSPCLRLAPGWNLGTMSGISWERWGHSHPLTLFLLTAVGLGHHRTRWQIQRTFGQSSSRQGRTPDSFLIPCWTSVKHLWDLLFARSLSLNFFSSNLSSIKHNRFSREVWKDFSDKKPFEQVSKEAVCGSTLLQDLARLGKTSAVVALLQHGSL